MRKTVHGVVHGRTIELESDLDIADGQSVELQVRPIQAKAPWGEGIRRSAGGWADHPEMDAILETIHKERNLERRTHPVNE